MGAATGAAVEAGDGDDAEVAFAGGRFAEALHFGGVLELDGDRPVLEDDLVGAALGVEDRAWFDGQRLRDRWWSFGAEVKADGFQAEELLEDGGEQVLAGVLLHVVEAAGPVEGAVDGPVWSGSGEAVRDAVVLVDDFDNGDAGDGAGIEGLAAGGGVERGAVEVDGAAVVGAVEDTGGEFAEVGVGVVEALGHGRIIAERCAQHDCARWRVARHAGMFAAALARSPRVGKEMAVSARRVRVFVSAGADGARQAGPRTTPAPAEPESAIAPAIAPAESRGGAHESVAEPARCTCCRRAPSSRRSSR